MARWTAKVFVDSSVGEINPVVEAGTPHGARQQIERIYGPVTQIVNLREVNSGGGGSSSEPGGCGGVMLLIIGAVVVGIFGAGGEKKGDPSTFPETAPMERVAEPYVPPAPEPQFQDYETPPPSYCVTENFEPC